MTGKWLSQEIDDGVVHVVPLRDLIEHESDDDCACGPSVEIVVHHDAPDGHVHVHHSLDGREAQEPGSTT